MSTIYIMWLRQIIRYLRSPPRILGALAQPLLYIVAFGYGFGAIYQAAGQGNYIAFLSPGIIGMSILFTSIFSGIELIFDRQFGFLKETLVAPVSRLNVMLGRSAGSATIAAGQGLVVLLITLALGFRPADWTVVPLAILVMFLIAFLFTSLGTWFATMLTDMQGFQLIMNFLVMPMFFLSGAMFPLDRVPGWLATIARFDPLTYGIDALRALLLGSSAHSLALDLGVLAAITVALALLSARSFSRIQV